ncbi:MAG: hypothetical protein M1820_009035 [Bogoriella megaspora]|nr:MAG: hypothetical protein M1820_009035 [Bogoriella megaspora]
MHEDRSLAQVRTQFHPNEKSRFINTDVDLSQLGCIVEVSIGTITAAGKLLQTSTLEDEHEFGQSIIEGNICTLNLIAQQIKSELDAVNAGDAFRRWTRIIICPMAIKIKISRSAELGKMVAIALAGAHCRMGKKRKASEISGGQGNHSNGNKAANYQEGKKFENPKTSRQEQNGRSLIFKPQPDWHSAELAPLSISTSLQPVPESVLENVRVYASSLLEAENAAYKSTQKSSSSSHKFLSTIMSSGTWEDKVSALTLLVQESPVHNIKAFENLLGLAKKRSRNQALLAIQAIKDLLAQGVVLPSDRKLRPFTKQPGLLSAFQGKYVSWRAGDHLPGGLEKTHLIYWAFEDWLKKTYFTLLTIIESWCNDEVEFSRKRALTFVFELLKEKPEQEENLLRLLINKLGDKEKRVASRASYLLLQLQSAHPAMKFTIVNAIESEMLFKPGQTTHAKYYAVITLNQTVLTMKEQEVANKLLAIYFSLFLVLLKEPGKDEKVQKFTKDGQAQGGGGVPGKKAQQKAKAAEAANSAEIELNDKVIAQVLTGVNRAYPFANTDDSDFEKHLNTMFRITHSSNFNTSVQALILIQQISSAKHYSADRFYRTLYESLLDPRVLGSSKQILYLNLLYKSLKADVSIKRVKAFVKRLLQVLALHEPPFVCGVLFLISELEVTFPSIRSMFDQPEENDHGDDVPNGNAPASNDRNDTHDLAARYDPRKRDPEHSNATSSCLWEVIPFLTHYHPSISLFASNLLSALPPPTKPDPAHYTLIHFLDKFSYRSAKTKSTARGASIMQPLAGADTADRLVNSNGKDKTKMEQPLNTGDFWMKKIEDVPADEVFFHKYFAETGKRKSAATKKKEKKSEDGDDDESLVADEDEIWKALVQSRPEVEGEDDDEFDEDVPFGDEDMLSDEEGGEGDVNFDDEFDEDGDLEGGGVELNFDDDEEESGSVPELEEDEEAFVGSDQDLPSDFEHFSDEDDNNIPDGAPVAESGKSEKSKKRKKLKSLPTFASADDYAKYLEDDDEEI